MAAKTISWNLGKPERTSRRFVFLRRSRQNKLVLVGGFIVLLIVLAAIFAPLLSPYSPYEQHNVDQLQSPNSTYLLGSDDFGRDILSRVLYGARISVQVAVISVSIGLIVGGLMGLIAAYYGGWLDMVIMRIADIIFAFPALLMAVGVLALLGPSLFNVMVAIGIIFIPIFTRVVRAAGLVLVNEQYVEASRASGAGDFRIMLRHILPNALPPIMVQTTLAISYAILSEAALSFLGLGAQPPEPSWGTMLNTGRGFMSFAPWTGIVPGAAIFLAVLSFNVLGDGLRDVLDPRMKV
jgi:peptide/nickel transport system permease protein